MDSFKIILRCYVYGGIGLEKETIDLCESTQRLFTLNLLRACFNDGVDVEKIIKPNSINRFEFLLPKKAFYLPVRVVDCGIKEVLVSLHDNNRNRLKNEQKLTCCINLDDLPVTIQKIYILISPKKY